MKSHSSERYQAVISCGRVIMQYKVVLTFEFVDEILKCDHSNESYWTEQYFPVVLFIMLCEVFLTFEFVDEILKCDYSNESCWALFFCGAVYYAVQVVLSFEYVDEILSVTSKVKVTKQYFPVELLCC